MNEIFKVGDHVRNLYTGEHGIICVIYNPDFIGVRWDNEKSIRHSCGNRCDSNHGWNVNPAEIKLISGNNDVTSLEILDIENLFT